MEHFNTLDRRMMVCFGLICVSRLVFYERDAYVSQLAVVLLVLLFADFVYLPYKVVPIYKAVKDHHNLVCLADSPCFWSRVA